MCHCQIRNLFFRINSLDLGNGTLLHQYGLHWFVIVTLTIRNEKTMLDISMDKSINVIWRQSKELTFNPTKPQIRENLFNGLPKNYNRFFIKKYKKYIHIFKETIVVEERFLDHMIVTSFIEEKFIPSKFRAWLAILNGRLSINYIVTIDNNGHSFFYLKASSKEVAYQLLVFVLYKAEKIISIF